MDHDLTIMIYGATLGVVGSILSSIVTAMFQLWLAPGNQPFDPGLESLKAGIVKENT